MSGVRLNRRALFQAAAGSLAGTRAKTAQAPPNFVIICADDLGYGDLGCYGSRIRTPNLDRVAAEGALFTQYYSASPVCSPSRAALLTGRYPTRVGVPSVLTPSDQTGLDPSELTLAQMLKERGYRTACIGKWHLGCQARFLPTSRGFDEFFGLPYSNDMWPLPLLAGTEVIEDPARLDTLAPRFAEQAVRFINRSKDAPFLLYYATVSSHIPLVPPKQFRGKSRFGLYGDVVQTLDWCVGEVLRALRENGLDENTLVLFSSDNGPWYQGSAGPLRGRKGETYEGGVRVPFLARYTGRIPERLVCRGVASALDVFPTLARLAGAAPPANPLDGVDIWPLLTGEREAVDRDLLLFFDHWNLQCAREGPWKLHVSRYNSFAWGPAPAAGRLNLPLPRPELYNLEGDPEESYDVAGDYPEVVADIRARMEEKLLSFPSPILLVWNHTMSRPVEDTPSGALPILKSDG